MRCWGRRSLAVGRPASQSTPPRRSRLPLRARSVGVRVPAAVFVERSSSIDSTQVERLDTSVHIEPSGIVGLLIPHPEEDEALVSFHCVGHAPMERTLPVFPVSARAPRGCFWLRTEKTRGTRADTGGHGRTRRRVKCWLIKGSHGGSERSWVAAERSDAALGQSSVNTKLPLQRSRGNTMSAGCCPSRMTFDFARVSTSRRVSM